MKRQTLRRLRRLLLGSLISAASVGMPLGAAEVPSSDSVPVGSAADTTDIQGKVPPDARSGARPRAERQISRTSASFHRSMAAIVSPALESWPPIDELGSSVRDLVGCWVAAHQETLASQFADSPGISREMSEQIADREPEPERNTGETVSDRPQPDLRSRASRPRVADDGAASYGAATEEYRPYDIADCDRYGNPYDPAWDCLETAGLAAAPSADACPFETFWNESPCRPPRHELASRLVDSRSPESQPREAKQPAGEPHRIVNLSQAPAVFEDAWCHPDGWALASTDLERAVDPTFSPDVAGSDGLAEKLPAMPPRWMPRFDRPQCVWPRDLRVGWSPLEAAGDFAVTPPLTPASRVRTTPAMAGHDPGHESSHAEAGGQDDEWRRAVSMARRWQAPLRRFRVGLEGTDLRGVLGRIGQQWFVWNRAAETRLGIAIRGLATDRPERPGRQEASTAGQRLLARAEAIEAAAPPVTPDVAPHDEIARSPDATPSPDPVEVPEIAEVMNQLRQWWTDTRPYAQPWLRLATPRSPSESALH